MELFRPDLVHRADDAPEDVIQAVIAPGTFDSGHIARLGHHTDGAAVPRQVRTDRTGVAGRIVKADRAEVDLLFDLTDRIREAIGVGLALLEQEVGDALR